ncbi:MAG: hypothetical protein GF344_00690 [Chitinivibrionales bacterium]|nr:hypothetical protein [Chitinivibrionales bacterium]MBD3355638.1 hypothetical protein [Chitinivibrionales bacterium]
MGQREPRKYALLTIVFVLLSGAWWQSSGEHYSSPLGYTIDLPEGWVAIQESDTQDIFFDTSQSPNSYLSVVSHAWQSDKWTEDESWTRSHLIGYLITAEHGANPWGDVVFYDSTASATLGDLWAPEVYTKFYWADTTTKAWAEYIIFASRNQVGYELYAVGDTTDMNNNGPVYSAILRSVNILPKSSTRRHVIITNRHTHRSPTAFRFDLLGRRLSAPGIRNGNPEAKGVMLITSSRDGTREMERVLRIKP